MRWVDVGQHASGVLAIGQEAVGVIAIGQMATGVVAVGQLARGVFVLGQLAVGVVAVGQLALGVVWVAAMLGIGARGRGIVWQVLRRVRSAAHVQGAAVDAPGSATATLPLAGSRLALRWWQPLVLAVVVVAWWYLAAGPLWSSLFGPEDGLVTQPGLR